MRPMQFAQAAWPQPPTHSPTHHMARHPQAPWLELRLSRHSLDCYQTHSHAEYAIGVVDAGQACLQTPTGLHPVGPGQVVLLSPDQPHACNPWPHQAWSYRMLFIEAGWLHARLQAPDTPAPLAGAPCLHFAAPTADDPQAFVALDVLCQPLHADTDLVAWQHGLLDFLARWARPGPAPTEAPAPSVLAPALALLAGPADLPLTVAQLAQACGLSTAQFIRRFKACFGLTPGDHLLNRRVNLARALLAQGRPIADAAAVAGFADQAHLQRAFKARHAMTPGTYGRRGE